MWTSACFQKLHYRQRWKDSTTYGAVPVEKFNRRIPRRLVWMQKRSWTKTPSTIHLNEVHLLSQSKIEVDQSETCLEMAETDSRSHHPEIFTPFGELSSLFQSQNAKSVADYVWAVRKSLQVQEVNLKMPAFRNWVAGGASTVFLILLCVLGYRCWNCAQKSGKWTRVRSRRRADPARRYCSIAQTSRPAAALSMSRLRHTAHCLQKPSIVSTQTSPSNEGTDKKQPRCFRDSPRRRKNRWRMIVSSSQSDSCVCCIDINRN